MDVPLNTEYLERIAIATGRIADVFEQMQAREIEGYSYTNTYVEDLEKRYADLVEEHGHFQARVGFEHSSDFFTEKDNKPAPLKLDEPEYDYVEKQPKRKSHPKPSHDETEEGRML